MAMVKRTTQVFLVAMVSFKKDFKMGLGMWGVCGGVGWMWGVVWVGLGRRIMGL